MNMVSKLFIFIQKVFSKENFFFWQTQAFFLIYKIFNVYEQWDFRYPNSRYLDASVNERFYSRADFLHIILSHLSGILRPGSGRPVFTAKHSSTINFASYNRTVKFYDTPLNTTESLRLPMEFDTFSRCFMSRLYMYEHSSVPNHFQTTDSAYRQIELVTPQCTWLGYLHLHTCQGSSLFETFFILKEECEKLNFLKLKSKFKYIQSKPEVYQENKIRACLLIVSASVDLAIPQLVTNNVINQINVFEE